MGFFRKLGQTVRNTIGSFLSSLRDLVKKKPPTFGEGPGRVNTWTLYDAGDEFVFDLIDELFLDDAIDALKPAARDTFRVVAEGHFEDDDDVFPQVTVSTSIQFVDAVTLRAALLAWFRLLARTKSPLIFFVDRIVLTRVMR